MYFVNKHFAREDMIRRLPCFIMSLQPEIRSHEMRHPACSTYAQLLPKELYRRLLVSIFFEFFSSPSDPSISHNMDQYCGISATRRWRIALSYILPLPHRPDHGAGRECRQQRNVLSRPPPPLPRRPPGGRDCESLASLRNSRTGAIL